MSLLRLTSSLSSLSVHGWNQDGLPAGSMARLMGSLVVEVPGGGSGTGVGLVVVGMEVVVADVLIIRNLGGKSSSESSELRPVCGLSVTIGSGGGAVADSGAGDSTRCFFFGCGASTEWARCFERTGTGMVIRVVALG